ncbi:MAG: glycosyltransferase family 9 protein [Spirochaetia bacterium]|nr:glycosyltransferase family 9 protein [Spirochaetia bacterium]
MSVLHLRTDRRLQRENIRRILIAGCGLFGDAILSAHALHSLRHYFPKAVFHLVAPQYVWGIYKEILSFEKFLPWNKKENCRTVREIRETAYDLAFILRGGFTHALAARMARIPHRLGFSSDHRAFLLTGHVRDSRRIPNYQNFLNLLKTFPLEIPEKYFRFPYTRYPAREPYFSIGPCASELTKTWDLRSFIAVVKEVVRRTGWLPVYLGQKSEWAYNEVLRLATGGENLSGELSLPELFSRLGTGNFFLGNNSGLAHLAGVLGTPAFVVSGPSDPVFTKPFGERVHMIYKEAKGIPLHRRGEKKFRRKLPMSAVAAADVLDELARSGLIPGQ